MAVEIFVHKMSEHMEEAQILEWRVKEGDWVEQYQIIMEVQTDKVNAELESPASGVIKGIRPGAVDGATVPVGEPLGYIAAPDEMVPVLSPLPGYHRAGEPAALTTAAPIDPAPTKAADGSGVRATPVARKVAKDLGVDIEMIAGSGPNGRVTEQDVRDFAASRFAPAQPAPRVQAALVPAPVPAAGPASRPTTEASTGAGDEWLDYTPVQRVTAERMLESMRSAPQFALTITVDMTNCLWLREAVGDRIDAETGARPSITALLVKAAAVALLDHPRANASYDNGRILLRKQVNVGVAMGTDDGLVVPVIRDADRKSLAQVSAEIRAFQDKLATLRYSAEDLAGGSFTVSNLGMYGIDHFNAIVNPPQSAILAVGQIAKTPVGLPNDTIALRPLMIITLSVDHRVMDGLIGARYLARLKERLEKPYFMIS